MGHQMSQLLKKVILPAWFDHLEERLSYKNVQFKKFYPAVKTCCPPGEN